MNNLQIINTANPGLRFFTVYGPCLSRLSRGRISVHWGEMRSKFQREGRPDMALFLFTKAILEDKPIQVFNNGNMVRDFTYVDDIVEGVVRVIDNPPEESLFKAGVPEEPATKGPHESGTDAAQSSPSGGVRGGSCPYKVYNIGNSSPVQLMEYIGAIEQFLDKTAQKEFLPMQPGDVPRTEADVTDLMANFNYKPDTPIVKGIEKFITWYRTYFELQ
jgi:UDP-glucuronate 4-epimerase